jgi:N-methylhydantoinase A
LGIDIGGTFTDIVLYDAGGRLLAHKVSTSTSDEARAVVSGTLQLLGRARVAPGEVAEVVHASTIATNAILEKTGPAVGLVTTAGFRDVLEIARIRTPKLYDLDWQKPAALVLRRHRHEIRERIGADGEVVTQLDETSVRHAIDRLRAAGINDVAVCLINSPVNGSHERRVGALFEQLYPECSVSLSCVVLPELKEYERTSTTVVNAYLRPVMRRYLGELRAQLREHGIDAPLNVMRSDGGMMSDAATCERPVAAVISGPAAGVTAARIVAERGSQPDVLAFDMGGTTAKATIIEGGRVPRVNEYEVRDGISTPSRFIKAGGYLLMVPAIDLAEVGNGAGSVARVDAGGALRVGPESAGAEPGPACYGRGGTRPTVTDANVVLGYLNPDGLVGGALAIDPTLSRTAIREEVSTPLGLDLVAAAWGIHCLANSNMIRAIRSVTVERGRDPRAFALVAFGGSGPVHAAGVASEMGMSTIIVPQYAGLLSAIGLLVSRVEQQFSRAWTRPLQSTDSSELRAEMQPLVERACAALNADGHDAQEVEMLVDLHFAGQGSSLSVTFHPDASDPISVLADDFTSEYRRTYGHMLQDEPINVMTLRAIARAPAPTRDIYGTATPAQAGRGGSRRAYFGPNYGYLEARRVSRIDLAADRLDGPILIEEYDTTIVVPPRWSARATDHHDLLIEAS